MYLIIHLALRSKLELPLERAHTQVANFNSCHHVLRWCLGSYLVGVDTLQQDTYMAASRIRCWSWSSQMVPGIEPWHDLIDLITEHIFLYSDAVGDLITCTVHSMGWIWRTVSWDLIVAVAGGFRRSTRCRTGHDLAPGENNVHDCG